MEFLGYVSVTIRDPALEFEALWNPGVSLLGTNDGGRAKFPDPIPNLVLGALLTLQLFPIFIVLISALMKASSS